MLHFEHPFFLWGMLAAAIPPLLHLLNRIRPDQIVFPSIRFLERSGLQQKGRRRISDVLVALLRSLVIMLFMLVLAGPGLPPDTVASGRERRIFIVDCSASMTASGCRENAIDILKKKFRDGDLIIFSGAKVLGEADEVPENIPLTLEAGRHGDALAAATTNLEKGDTLVIVSDFRQNDWENAAGLVPDDIKLEFSDCGKTLENVGIPAVRTSALPAGRVRVVVTVVNYSYATCRRNLIVSVGKEQKEVELSLPPGGTRRVPMVFSVPDNSGEVRQGIAVLDEDGYALDDKYCFALKSGRLPKALVIGGEKIVFVGHALTGAFEVEAMSPLEVMPEDFIGVQAVFIAGEGVDVSMVPENVPVVFSGAGNPTLRELRRLGRLNAVSAGRAVSSLTHSLGVGTVKDEKLKELFGNDSDLFTYRIPFYNRLNVGSGTDVVIESLDGEPLLIRQEKCFFFAFPFDDFVLCSSFLPLLRELAAAPEDFGIVRKSGGQQGVFEYDGEIIEVNPPSEESVQEIIHEYDLAVRIQTKGRNVPDGRMDLRPVFAFVLALCFLALSLLRR